MPTQLKPKLPLVILQSKRSAIRHNGDHSRVDRDVLDAAESNNGIGGPAGYAIEAIKRCMEHPRAGIRIVGRVCHHVDSFIDAIDELVVAHGEDKGRLQTDLQLKERAVTPLLLSSLADMAAHILHIWVGHKVHPPRETCGFGSNGIQASRKMLHCIMSLIPIPDCSVAQLCEGVCDALNTHEKRHTFWSVMH
eukprot:4044725-Prymnesium_polylepis.1